MTSEESKIIEEFEKKYRDTLPECSICQSVIYKIDEVTLQCGHQFHKRCLARWAGDPKRNPIDMNKTCPICRGPLIVKKSDDVIRRDAAFPGGSRRKKTRRVKSKRRKSKRRKSFF